MYRSHTLQMEAPRGVDLGPDLGSGLGRRLSHGGGSPVHLQAKHNVQRGWLGPRGATVTAGQPVCASLLMSWAPLTHLRSLMMSP